MSTLPLLILLAASSFGFAGAAETGKEILLVILLHPHFASFQLNAIPTTIPRINRRTPPVSDSGNMMAKSMRAARIQATQRMDCGVQLRQTPTWNTQNGVTATWKLTRATQKVCKALSSKKLLIPYLYLPGLCITYAGTVPNTPCVKGPWKYKGVEYTGCANPSSNELGYWCPTEVTADGDYISKKWGYCNMEIASCNPQGEAGFHV